MKTFYDVPSAFNWIDKVVKKTNNISLAEIAEQVYKDSDKYTFRETGQMFDSGALYSRFKEGYVIERAPQVRFLYYATNVNAGDGNRNAIPQWFEKTKRENINTYKKMYSKLLEQQKGGA